MGVRAGAYSQPLAASLVRTPSLPARAHPACDVALPPVHPARPQDRGAAGMRASERVLPVRPVAGILSLPERLGVGHQAGPPLLARAARGGFPCSRVRDRRAGTRGRLANPAGPWARVERTRRQRPRPLLPPAWPPLASFAAPPASGFASSQAKASFWALRLRPTFTSISSGAQVASSSMKAL